MMICFTKIAMLFIALNNIISSSFSAAEIINTFSTSRKCNSNHETNCLRPYRNDHHLLRTDVHKNRETILQHIKSNHRKQSVLTIPRGGGIKNINQAPSLKPPTNEHQITPTTTTTTNSTATSPPPKTTTTTPPPSLSTRLTAAHNAALNLRNKQKRTLFLLRIVLLLTLPIATLALLLSLLLTTLLTILRALTLNLLFSDTHKLSLLATHALISTNLACIVGAVVSPSFAIFGLMASILSCGVDAVEPFLRIKYAGQLRRLRHLQSLAEDPVLVETLDLVVKGARVVSDATGDVRRDVRRVAKRRVTAVTNALGDGGGAATTELVEALYEKVLTASEPYVTTRRVPPEVQKWMKGQVTLLKTSGVLESAAQAAMVGIRDRVGSLESVIPYLEALRTARENLEKAARLEARKRTNNRWGGKSK